MAKVKPDPKLKQGLEELKKVGMRVVKRKNQADGFSLSANFKPIDKPKK